jgi:Flp pilus assembly protein TadG
MRTQKRLSRAEGGNVMIEFALLAPIFFMLIMGLVEFCLYQYKTYALNHIVYEATRNLQTGEVQGAEDMRERFDELCQIRWRADGLQRNRVGCAQLRRAQ